MLFTKKGLIFLDKIIRNLHSALASGKVIMSALKKRHHNLLQNIKWKGSVPLGELKHN